MSNAALASSLLILVSSLDLSFACFASGVCGGGCAPPPPPVCSGGCGGGYQCGHYGCYRARARAASSLTLSVDGRESKKPSTPDEMFMACCIDRNLPDSCLNKCSFRTYTKAALQVDSTKNQLHLFNINH
ncbi:unnamed protein product [Strongylus vulgaris]|uniref:Domain of unknown function DB domain-containing protein n=1 Tax=Strongylus vulgaris TaxID=40348 RepID=A0A3P7M1P5_STRVU|nr:unnamed protein product [Strongylus vulgaris]